MAEFDLAELMEAYRRKWEDHRAGAAGYNPAVYKCSPCKDMGYIDLYPSDPRKPANGKISTVVYCPYCRTDMLKDMAGIIAEYRELNICKFPWDTYKVYDKAYDKDKKDDILKIKQVIESFVYDFHRWRDEGIGLYIYSNAKGSGKTMAASAVCSSICAKYNMPVRFAKVEDLLSDVQKSYDSRRKNELSVVNVRKYWDADLLVLDDLGVSKITEWGQGVLHELINERYKANRQCIITSNFKLAELPIHPATVDRINDMCLVLHFPEVPVRSRKALDRKGRLMQYVDSYDKFVDCGRTPFEGGMDSETC